MASVYQIPSVWLKIFFSAVSIPHMLWSLSLEISQLYQMSSPSTSRFARTTAIGHQQLLCTTISLPGLSPPVTPSNSHWQRWGTHKTQQPPQMQKTQVAGDSSPSFSMVRRVTEGIGGHAQRWQSPASSQPSISATTSSSAEGQLMDLAEHGLSGLIFNRFGSVVQLTTWLDKHRLLGRRWGQKQTLHFCQVEAILDPTLCLQSERSQAHRILTSLSEPRPCPALTC